MGSPPAGLLIARPPDLDPPGRRRNPGREWRRKVGTVLMVIALTAALSTDVSSQTCLAYRCRTCGRILTP